MPLTSYLHFLAAFDTKSVTPLFLKHCLPYSGGAWNAESLTLKKVSLWFTSPISQMSDRVVTQLGAVGL